MKDLEEKTTINEAEAEKVAGGVPILHPIRHYENPPAEPEEPEEGGAQGTW